MRITGAIFDMDGTLLNSMDYWGMVAEEYLKGQGIVPKENTNKIFLEDGMKSWYSYSCEKYGLSASYDEAKAGIYSLMDKWYESDVSVKEGVRELLECLYQKGVKMCLATATDRQSVEKILTRLNLTKYFSRIFTSGEVGAGKREPLIYELALEYLGTSKDTTYVFEDAIYAMKTAYTNGFKVVGVYDKNVYATEDEVKGYCHIYLDKNSKYRMDLE